MRRVVRSALSTAACLYVPAGLRRGRRLTASAKKRRGGLLSWGNCSSTRYPLTFGLLLKSCLPSKSRKGGFWDVSPEDESNNGGREAEISDKKSLFFKKNSCVM